MVNLQVSAAASYNTPLTPLKGEIDRASATISRAALAQGAICNLDKPEGWTSFDVVNKLRGASRIKKVGHAGTLDPFATGVLLICFASATKQVESLMKLEKEYEGTLVLGVDTDSHDVTGKIINQQAVPALTQTEIAPAVQKYVGEIMQVPPMFSALKKEGRRLYDLARAGESVELEPRAVTIHAIELLRVNLPELTLRVTCSRGTYIRALARDLGKDFGCGAYLKTLRRTRIGEYRSAQSLTVAQFVERLTD
ncbi:tRNA pseudouridine(55) synthase TruB [candidate division KSB1 bacterium]|nr:tRNA pseudouridine(55) synthase TruB [candidate division KSB1 bacterium]